MARAVCPACEGALIYVQHWNDMFRCGNCERTYTFHDIKAGQGYAAAQAAAITKP